MNNLVSKKSNRVAIVIIIPILLILAVVAYLIIKQETGISIKCQTKEIFDIDCAGCGVTRMIESIMQLDLYQAFRWNPLMFISLPLILIFYLYQSYYFVEYASISDRTDKLLIIYFIILMIFGILRNIEFFSWLAPTEL